MSLKQLLCPALFFAMLATLVLAPATAQAGTLSELDELYAWYRADTGVVTAEGSSTITSWEDQSGNERDLTVSGNPTLTTNGNDGTAAVTFDGSDYLYSTLANWGTATTTTVLAVWKATGSPPKSLDVTGTRSNPTIWIRQERWFVITTSRFSTIP